MQVPRTPPDWRAISRWAWAPFFIAGYAILFLYERNIDRVVDVEVLYALGASIAGVAIVLAAGRALLRDRSKAALASAAAALYFFSIGHIWDVISAQGTALTSPLIVIGGLVIALAIIFTIGRFMTPAVAQKVLTPLNLVTGALMVFPAIGVAATLVPRLFTPPIVPPSAAPPPSLVKANNDADHPDIYYIILDGYGANKHLLREWGYDNSAFTRALEDRGFYVAHDGTSNYSKTLPSMASSLNMRYLVEGEQPPNDRSGNIYARMLIADNEVARLLQARGYTYVFMLSGWDRASTIADTNIDFYKDGPRWFSNGQLQPDDKFVKDSYLRLLVGTTAARDTGLADVLNPPVEDTGTPQWFQNPNRALNMWSTIEEVAAMPEATFAIGHVIKPHGPIRFDREGNIIPIPPDDQEEKYFFDELQFVNRRTLDMIDEILRQSDVPPIIIIQGDHGLYLSKAEGPDGRARYFEILNAYHFPNGGDKNLYQTISAVNSFRVMFNTYFGQTYELLSDDGHFEVPDDYRNLFHFEPSELPH